MKIAIIGGGAAGMMAAATINEENIHANVFLVEKNSELGKKVVISGGGRCNVTTGYEEVPEILTRYPRGAKFLQSSLYAFPPQGVRAWFENHGVSLKCEDDKRVFPVSDDGHDIVGAFTTVFMASKTKVLLDHKVQSMLKTATGFTLIFKDKEPLMVDKVILALGGQAYRHTGSTGDGYALAESLGHHITPLAASLNSFITSEKWPRSLAGVSFENARISVKREKSYSFTGAFLFTHLGVSGPAVFALSSLVAFEEYGPKNSLPLAIDLMPSDTLEELTMKMKDLMAASPKKAFKNTLHTCVPLSVAEFVCNQVGIPLEKINAETNKELLRKALTFLKHIPLSAVGRGAGDEFVTAGGVELSEVDPRTMESKLCPGLFFAGEILNIDGFTGGFNLQASWATGRLAGLNAAVNRTK